MFGRWTIPFKFQKTYFFIVSLQIQDVLKCGSRVDVDHISIDSSKQVAPIAEHTLGTNVWPPQSFNKVYRNVMNENNAYFLYMNE